MRACECDYERCIPKDNSRNSWVTRGNKCKRCGSQDDKRRKPREYTWRQKKTRKKNWLKETESWRGRVAEWASKKATKWNEMTKYVYDKQWKIHNEFEKDKCKWSEVDSSSLDFFYQEFLLLYVQRAFYIILYISAHCWAWNSIKWPVSRCRGKKCKQRKNEGNKDEPKENNKNTHNENVESREKTYRYV